MLQSGHPSLEKLMLSNVTLNSPYSLQFWGEAID